MRGSRRDRKLCDKMGFRTAARVFLLPPYSLTSSLLDRQIENWHRKPNCNKRCLTIEPRYKEKLTESKQPYQSTPSPFSVPSWGRRRFHQSAFLIPCVYRPFSQPQRLIPPIVSFNLHHEGFGLSIHLENENKMVKKGNGWWTKIFRACEDGWISDFANRDRDVKWRLLAYLKAEAMQSYT